MLTDEFGNPLVDLAEIEPYKHKVNGLPVKQVTYSGHSVCIEWLSAEELSMIQEYVIEPVRVCCGQHHLGPICPDNKVMCCICFDRFNLNELYADELGHLWDECKECHAEQEEGNKEDKQ